MKKNIKIGILIIIFVLFVLLLNYLLTPKMTEKIENYLIKEGYSLNEDASYYQKQISTLSKEEYNYYVSKKVTSTYEINTFFISNYRLIKEKNEYQNAVDSSLTETFDYTNDSLTYTYRINYKDANAIFKGSYQKDSEEFLCEKEFSYGLSVDKESVICEKLKLMTREFSLEAYLLFPNVEFINYMKDQKID